jgi:hypothetical protein
LGSHKALSQAVTVGSGRASGHYWIPSSPNPLPSTPRQMAKLRSSTKWSYISCTCTIKNTSTHGMRVLCMSNIATIEPCIAQLATTPFRWGWDSNHCAPWMLHYPWRPPRSTHPLLHQKLTKPPGSLSGSSTFVNKFRIFYKSLMPSTSSSMINIGCHISFRWGTKFGCICKENALQGPIRSFSHSVMSRTPSPRLWVTIILSSTFPPSLACIQSSTWLSFGHISHHYWTPQIY